MKKHIKNLVFNDNNFDIGNNELYIGAKYRHRKNLNYIVVVSEIENFILKYTVIDSNIKAFIGLKRMINKQTFLLSYEKCDT